MKLLWVLGVMIALIVVQSFFFGRFGLRHVHYARTFERKRLFAGESTVMVEVLENRKLLPVPWLRVESRMPATFRFAGRAAIDEDAGRFHRSIFFLRPYRRVERRCTVTPTQRGVYHLDTLALTCGDMMGLTQDTTTAPSDLRVTVYPMPLAPQELSLPSTRWQGELLARRFIHPDPFLYSGVRPYQAGDPPRDIHWAATARTGGLQVKQRDFTASPRLMVLVNVQVQERQWNMPGEADIEQIEHGIALAATAALYAIDHALEAGVASNAKLFYDETGRTLLLPPSSAPRQREAVLDALAQLTHERQVNFHTWLSRLRLPMEQDVLIVSPYRSALIDEQIYSLRARGHSVTFLLARKGEAAHA